MSPLNDIIEVAELNEIAEFMRDDNLTNALAQIIEIYGKENPPPLKDALTLIVKLQAYSATFKMQGKYYMLLGAQEPDSSKKKNVYLSVSESLDKLVDSLKYVVRVSS